MPDTPERKVQDDTREEFMARMLGLKTNEKRTGSDASDEIGNTYELKTTTTGSVTTGRDVGRPYLQRLRSRYTICSKGKQTSYGFTAEEVYFLHLDDMEDWIGGIEARLEKDLAVVDAALDAMRTAGASEEQLTRLRAIGNRGITLNNPKIPWAYVMSHGTKLEGNPAVHLRELVTARPLPPPQPPEPTLDDQAELTLGDPATSSSSEPS